MPHHPQLMRDELPPHGRVLVCDLVVPDEPGPTPAKMLDIEMLVMTVGGKERTERSSPSCSPQPA